MKRMTLPPAACAALAAILCVHPAEAESGPRYRNLKSQAMGGTGTASPGTGNALFLNPAALAGVEGGGMGLSTDVGLNPVLLEYADWAAKNYKYMKAYDTLATRIGEVDNKWAPFSQGLSLFGNYRDVGFALVMDNRYDLTVGKAVVTPVPGVGVMSDLVLTAGRGLDLAEGYRAGFALKYLYRIRFERQLLGTTDDAFYKINTAWREPGDGLADNLGKISVASEIAETVQGFGLNLGAEKDVAENWTAGIALLDFPTLLGSRLARPDINLGMSYHRGLDLVPDLDDRILVNLDFQRFLLPGTPWFKQIKAGAAFEASMGGRPVGFLALGLNDGYPTFGLSFGYILTLSYVYTAEEAGTYPGQEPLAFHKLSLQLEM